ncbi:MAG: NusG domain II-containing protein [Oscillospiraceae bacterium]|jgi:hypothetical protein|nr:NusG domain II-containing protein [Oscillospiraceae bacterium]
MKKGDVFIIIAVILLAGLTAAFFLRPSSPGAVAVVTVDGEVAARIPLDGAGGVYSFGADGQVRIRAEGGRARFEASDCPDQTCVRSGWLHAGGHMAACLPNRCLLAIEGADPGYDALLRGSRPDGEAGL